jgi:hypothetical protein
MKIVGEYELKGRPGAMPIYIPTRVLASSLTGSSWIGVASDSGRFIGRTAEMAKLSDFVAARLETPEEAPCLLLVRGEAGSGKSIFLSRAKDVIINRFADSSPTEPRVLMVYAKGDTKPLSFCHQLLFRLLELEGEQRAVHFSVLEVKERTRAFFPQALRASLASSPSLLLDVPAGPIQGYQKF